MKVQNFKTSVNPFSGNSIVNYHFNKSGLSQLTDNELGLRVKCAGYQYGEIFINLTNVYLSGGDAIEDINTHFRDHLKSTPGNNVPIAGMSNTLSCFADAQTHCPIIACPPYSNKFGGADIYSSIRIPSGATPLTVLSPENKL